MAAVIEQMCDAIMAPNAGALRALTQRHPEALSQTRQKGTPFPDSETATDAKPFLDADMSGMCPLQVAFVALDASGHEDIGSVSSQETDENATARREILDLLLEKTPSSTYNTLLWGKGNTTLHLAAFLGETEIVKSLISRGASPNVRNALGFAPVDVAFDAETREIFKTMAKPDNSPRKPVRPDLAALKESLAQAETPNPSNEFQAKKSLFEKQETKNVTSPSIASAPQMSISERISMMNKTVENDTDKKPFMTIKRNAVQSALKQSPFFSQMMVNQENGSLPISNMTITKSASTDNTVKRHTPLMKVFEQPETPAVEAKFETAPIAPVNIPTATPAKKDDDESVADIIKRFQGDMEKKIAEVPVTTPIVSNGSIKDIGEKLVHQLEQAEKKVRLGQSYIPIAAEPIIESEPVLPVKPVEPIMNHADVFKPEPETKEEQVKEVEEEDRHMVVMQSKGALKGPMRRPPTRHAPAARIAVPEQDVNEQKVEEQPQQQPEVQPIPISQPLPAPQKEDVIAEQPKQVEVVPTPTAQAAPSLTKKPTFVIPRKQPQQHMEPEKHLEKVDSGLGKTLDEMLEEESMQKEVPTTVTAESEATVIAEHNTPILPPRRPVAQNSTIVSELEAAATPLPPLPTPKLHTKQDSMSHSTSSLPPALPGRQEKREEQWSFDKMMSRDSFTAPVGRRTIESQRSNPMSPFAHVDKTNIPGQVGTNGVLVMRVSGLRDLRAQIPKDMTTLHMVFHYGPHKFTTLPKVVNSNSIDFQDDFVIPIIPKEDITVELYASVNKPQESKSTKIVNFLKGNTLRDTLSRKKSMNRAHVNSVFGNSPSMQSIASAESFGNFEQKGPKLKDGLVGMTDIQMATVLGKDTAATIVEKKIFVKGMLFEKKKFSTFRMKSTTVMGDLWGEGNNIAAIELNLFYLPNIERDVAPKSFAEVADWSEKKAYHANQWREGFLSQRGGDLRYWRRRLFKLTGSKLEGFHELHMDKRFTIDLADCKRASDNFRNDEDESELDEVKIPFGFRLEQDNGEIIEFYASNDEEKNAWMHIINEIASTAKTYRIPKWWTTATA